MVLFFNAGIFTATEFTVVLTLQVVPASAQSPVQYWAFDSDVFLAWFYSIPRRFFTFFSASCHILQRPLRDPVVLQGMAIPSVQVVLVHRLAPGPPTFWCRN